MDQIAVHERDRVRDLVKVGSVVITLKASCESGVTAGFFVTYAIDCIGRVGRFSVQGAYNGLRGAVLAENVQIGIHTSLVVATVGRLRLVPLCLFIAGSGAKIGAVCVEINRLDEASLSLAIEEGCVHSIWKVLHGVTCRRIGIGCLVVTVLFSLVSFLGCIELTRCCQ